MIITIERFLAAWDANQPKRWIRFAFKYFSKETAAKNMKLNNTIVYILLGLFLTGMAGTIMHLPRPIIALATYIFTGILTVLVLFLLAAVWANNLRIRRIVKYLGCTIEEYNKAADRFGNLVK
jgi:hypothetical protein